MSLKQQLYAEAEALRQRAVNAQQSAQHADGPSYYEEKRRADGLWQQYLAKMRQADDCQA